MLINKLPSKINPAQLCQAAPSEGMQMSGFILISELNDIDDSLKAQANTPISVSLNFSVDEQGFCCIRGEISAVVSLQCQRCLRPMEFQLSAKILVSPISSDEAAKKLPEHYEPLLVTSGEIAFSEWIAEELHLALPLVPRHDTPCAALKINTQ